MNSFRGIWTVALLAGLAGPASAQTMTLTTAPASPITYGTPVTLIAQIFGDNSCGGQEIQFSEGLNSGGFFGIGSATAVQTAPPPEPMCIAISPSLNIEAIGQVPLKANTPQSALVAFDTLVVNEVPSTIGLLAAPNPSTFGQTVALTATVSGSVGTPNGNVAFYDGGTQILTAVLSNGAASAQTAALTAGTHSLTASYGGIAPYFGSTSAAVNQTVNKAPTTTNLVATPSPSTVGQTVTLTANVSPASATGTVVFNDGLGAPVPAGVSNGVASVAISAYTLGVFTLTATYSGDANYLGSSSTPITQRITQIATTTSLQAVPASSTAGQNVVLTATVSPTASTGTVTFSDGVITVGSAGLISGTAMFSTSTLSIGSHSLTASYGGDTNDAPSSSQAVTETVGQTVTTTSLKAVPASSSPGQSVTLTASVSPATATGTVTFLDGSTTLGSAPLTAGTASISVSTLSTGNHSLTASYGGDANDAPSVSLAVTESVGLLTTTTTLTAAPNPSTAGQKVTLTATVSPGNPTGTVSFFDGANLLGSSPLAGGVATFSTAALSAGNHSLTATYSGDANNATSTSAAVTESVTGGTGSTTPNPVSVSPASGSGSSQVMVFTFNDSSGWQDLGVVNVLINNVLDGRNACYLAYSRSAGVLYLVADDGGTLSTGLVLGGAGSVSNSQCIVTGSASAAAGSGNTLTVALNIIFTAGFGGNKVMYLAAGNVAGGNSGWQALGVWQAPFTPAGTIAVVSLTQARSAAASGTAQTFTAALTDSQGAGDFGVVNLLVNNFIDGRQACYLAYVASTNSLLLVDDGGDAGGPFAGGVVLNGVAATIQNSQCSVNRVGSSAAKSGNTLTLMLNITFKSPFAGNRIVWVAGRDAAGGNNTGWQSMGTTTVE